MQLFLSVWDVRSQLRRRDLHFARAVALRRSSAALLALAFQKGAEKVSVFTTASI
jgi:hypothetical protein